ncbi:MAG: PEP-CTERM sorting domain-containing protein [Candidatus Omnitrophota bacterium]
MFSVFSASNALASFTEFKMVGSDTSTVTQNTFNLSETPYLYFTIAPAADGSIGGFWVSPANDSHSYDLTITKNEGTAYWLTVNDWSTVKEIGNWTVSGTYFGDTGSGYSTTNFQVVTPEPAAVALYAIGGIPLAFMFFRRRKDALI